MKNPISSRRLRLESLEERALLAVTAGFAETAALAAPTGATNWVVNTTADPAEWDETDDLLSLREAIDRAQTGDTITFDSSLAGGTITLSGSELSVDKCITIDANGIGGMTIDAAGQSEVFYVNDGSAKNPVELIGLTITGGWAEFGGGICTGKGCTLTLTNCIVSGNTAIYEGGGIYNGTGTLILTNCTVSGNTTIYGGYYSSGAGIYNYATIYLYNTIVAQNTADDDIAAFNTPYNDYNGGVYGYNSLSSSTSWWTSSEGCLTYDPSKPLFTDPENGDYTLAENSQAIDKGNNGYVRIKTDLTGNPRIVNGIVDLGAYEVQNGEVTEFEAEAPSTVVTTILDVTNLLDNLISLREAISYAESGDTITFDASIAGKTITLNGSELKIESAVSIDASSIGGMTIDADGKSRVFNVSGGTVDAPVVLIGLTITGGDNCDDAGGIYNMGKLSLVSCTVAGNRSSWSGGICNCDGSRLTLTNCIVTGNIGETKGGGIDNGGTLTLTNCTVAGNRAPWGGGIYNYYATMSLYNTIVAQNSSSGSGDDIISDGYGSEVYGYNTLSSFTSWPSSQGCLTYDSSKPLFTDAANGDYSLAENSQAIDKGNNDYVETETDLAGNARIVNGIVDLGAYEYQSGGGQTEPLIAPSITTGSNRVYVSYGANRHQIQWSAVENASGYELAYSADGNSWTSVFAAGTSAVVTGLTYGAAMQYRVRALGTGSYTDSDWSAVKTFSVCPMDINGDGDISGGDRTQLANSWLSEEGEDEFRYYCDITGDGDIGGADRAFLSNNWLLNVEDDADDLAYPPAKAFDAVFAEFASADLAIDLDQF